MQTTKNTKNNETIRMRPQAPKVAGASPLQSVAGARRSGRLFPAIQIPQTPISNLARQQDHAIQPVMTEVTGIRTSGSLLTVITDRSCITPQTQPVVQ
jgi:hypothetical protein